MTFKNAVQDFASLPALGNSVDDLRCALDTGIIYRWDGASWNSEGTRFNIYGQAADTDALAEGVVNLYGGGGNLDGGSANSVYGGTSPVDGGSA